MSLADAAADDWTPPPRPEPPTLDPRAVRAYDIRGVVGVHLGPKDAYGLGLSYAELAHRRGLSRIAVGRDGRLSSPVMEPALVAGLVDGGLQVRRLGLCPTPMVSFAVRELGLDGGIMVTASHNPSPENGFKILLGAERIHGEALLELTRTPGRRRPGGSERRVRLQARYVDRLASVGVGLKPLRVAWDSGNGATGRVVERLVRSLPGEHVLLNSRIDGRFPAHHPDPAVGDNLRQLQAAVLEHGCDVGLAFDGDGDRIGVVDPEGEILWADQHLLFLAEDLLTRRPGATVVGDVKSSRVLFEGVEARGGRAAMTPSGYVLVRERMKSEGALLGGELSGHIFYADEWDGGDDALYVAVRTLRALSDSGRSLADFRRGLPPTVATPELRIPCPDRRKHEVVAECARRLRDAGADVDAACGLRVNTPDGWWLLRASGTEPKLTVRCEAADAEGLRRLRAEVAAHLAEAGIALP